MLQLFVNLFSDEITAIDNSLFHQAMLPAQAALVPHRLIVHRVLSAQVFLPASVMSALPAPLL